MIKRYTPSKIYPQTKRENSCCGFCPGVSDSSEVTLQLLPKRLKVGRPQTPLKNAQKNKLQLGREKGSSNTSQNSLPSSPHPSQSHSRTKTLQQTAVTIDRSPIFESFPENLPSMELRNPLQRLRRRLFRVNSLQTSPHPSLPRASVPFTYFPKTIGVGAMGSASVSALGGQIREQPQDFQTCILREIQQSRREFEGLLREQSRLNQEKEGNRRHYQQLLGRIVEKEEELRELERLRREELGTLRKELEYLLVEREREGRRE